MRPFLIITALLIGGMVTFTEFKSIKESTLFSDWFDPVPFVGLCVLTFVFLVLNIRRYINTKQITSLLPLLICVSSLIIISWHKKTRENLDNSATNFTATTSKFGSDGGFVLDFKKNGHLKAERRDHWAVTYYWGKYSCNNDTVNLDIPLNFKLGRQAVLTNTSLRFIDDTIRFQVFKQ